MIVIINLQWESSRSSKCRMLSFIGFLLNHVFFPCHFVSQNDFDNGCEYICSCIKLYYGWMKPRDMACNDNFVPYTLWDKKKVKIEKLLVGKFVAGSWLCAAHHWKSVDSFNLQESTLDLRTFGHHSNGKSIKAEKSNKSHFFERPDHAHLCEMFQFLFCMLGTMSISSRSCDGMYCVTDIT